MNIVKIVMVGDGYVGKTSGALAFKTGHLPYEYVPTVFANYEFTIHTDTEDVLLSVRKTPGPEDYDRLRTKSYPDTDVVLIWFSVTSPASYTNVLEKWYPEIRHHCPSARLILVGTKIDLRKDPDTLRELANKKERVLTLNDGRKLALKIHAKTYLECSSKTLVGIEEVFKTAAKIGIEGATLDKPNRNERKSHGIHPSLMRMVIASKDMFNEVLKLGMEENYDVRVMAVGQAGVGKSTLTRRLLKLPVKIKEYNSTNGIEVHIRSCQIDLDTGKWVYKKRGLVSNILSILRKRRTKHETISKTAKNQADQDFHQRCAKLLQNFGFTEEEYSGYNDIPADEQNTEKIDGTEKRVDQTGTETLSGDKSGSARKIVRKPNEISDEDVNQTIKTAKNLNPVKYIHRAKVSFYDFAGQDIFHASHPTFLSPKSIFTLVFDLNKIYSQKDDTLTKKYERAKFFGDCRGGSTLGNIESLFFWLNVIYLFSTPQYGGHSQVILVGTHKDRLPKTNREQIVDECFKDLRREIADTPLMDILSQEEIAVDNTQKTDESFSKLRDEILRLAKVQPEWGQKTPTKWLPLNREVQQLQEDGLKVLSMTELEELNESLDVKLNDTAELDMFLQFQHDSGEIIWFSEKDLRKCIVLDQVWLIDALKLIITAERFALRIPKLAEKWKDFNQTGVIDRATIVSILEKNEDPAFFENHEHVLLLMEKYLFIASPLTQLEEKQDTGGSSEQLGITGPGNMNLSDICTVRNAADDRSNDGSELEVENTQYIMPCMVHKVADCASLLSAQDFGKSALFCMVSTRHFLPPAVFQKVLAMCIRKWPIVEQKGQKSLYCGLCKFNIDTTKNYKLLMFLVGYAIHVRIENYVSTNEPPTAICTEVRLFLVQSLRSVLLGMGFCDDFRECIQCPNFDPLENGGYFDFDLCEDQVAITCDDCELSHGLQTEALVSCWTNKKRLDHLENDSLEQEPAEIKDRDDNAADNQNNDERDISDAFGTNSYDEESPITQDHINHARVCNALVSVGADALREILLFKVPTGFNDIYGAIKANRGTLFGMRQLRQEQLSLIYPDPLYRYTGTVDQFDITLLYTLIRNLSSVQAPVTGWNQPPDDNPRDTSLGANVERIRSCRNKVSGHSIDGKLDNQCFETYWQEIGEMIDDIENAIGDKGFKDALERRRKQVITPKEAQLLQMQIKTFQGNVQTLVVAFENLGEQLKKLQSDIDK